MTKYLLLLTVMTSGCAHYEYMGQVDFNPKQPTSYASKTPAADVKLYVSTAPEGMQLDGDKVVVTDESYAVLGRVSVVADLVPSPRIVAFAGICWPCAVVIGLPYLYTAYDASPDPTNNPEQRLKVDEKLREIAELHNANAVVYVTYQKADPSTVLTIGTARQNLVGSGFLLRRRTP